MKLPPTATAFATALGVALLGIALALAPAAAGAREPVPTAVLDFDNDDTAGESPERAAEHAALVESFAGILRERLAGDGGFRVVALPCPAAPCTAKSLPADKLIETAQQAGARLLVYGGIHKMSTLIQFGAVQAIDLETDKLVLSRSFSFRGDNEEAFRRAADFVLRYLEEVELEP